MKICVVTLNNSLKRIGQVLCTYLEIFECGNTYRPTKIFSREIKENSK